MHDAELVGTGERRKHLLRYPAGFAGRQGPGLQYLRQGPAVHQLRRHHEMAVQLCRIQERWNVRMHHAGAQAHLAHEALAPPGIVLAGW